MSNPYLQTFLGAVTAILLSVVFMLVGGLIRLAYSGFMKFFALRMIAWLPYYTFIETAVLTFFGGVLQGIITSGGGIKSAVYLFSKAKYWVVAMTTVVVLAAWIGIGLTINLSMGNLSFGTLEGVAFGMGIVIGASEY